MPHDAPDGPRKVLGWPTIWIAATIILLVTIGSGFVLFLIYPPPESKEALDIIRTAGTLGMGTGGAAALLLHARRQQAAEQANEYTRQANENARYDAEERRITELQAQANEQLGNEKASVRLGALTLLKRLANSYPDHQQDIVDILCAYLRMPFDHPDQIATNSEHDDSALKSKIKEAREELQVRLTVQRILTGHLKFDIDYETGERINKNFWNDIRLDLSGAVLVKDFDFSSCRASDCDFSGARFEGFASFAGADISGLAWFKDANFAGWAWFNEANFGDAMFVGTYFGGDTRFAATRFAGAAVFKDEQFAGPVIFDDVRFRWDLRKLPSTWPSGWVGKAPESDAGGRIEGMEGIWGCVVSIDDTQPAAADGDGGGGVGDVFADTPGAATA
ncbi:pentapeptide repeat-containing protein [Saccharopolyspora shandongensis]|uniref:pentapeptide repeat-containing protein n=1 Tax=Saccharopolyspora shandongensis TaxID=418495 RepID=UPI003442F599